MYDIIGDVHGCIDELRELVELLGYTFFATGLILDDIPAEEQSHRLWFHPENRKLVFAGDLNDRGPSSADVFDFVRELVRAGLAHVIQGNHDNKLMRYLRSEIEGKEWTGRVSHGLENTLKELHERGFDYKVNLYNFLKDLPYKFETDDLIVVHAAYKENLESKKEKDMALYGDVDKDQGYSESGFPVRLLNWKEKYTGNKTIVFGHIVHDEERFQKGVEGVRSASERVYITAQGSKIIAVDWGVPHGGELAAYRFPNDEFMSIKAKKVYYVNEKEEKTNESSRKNV